jgi:PKD repeat protein
MKRLLAIFALSAQAAIAQTPPNANFTANPTTACAGQTITFTNTSTQGTAAITNYSWDFGDGNSSTATNATHTYTIPNTYTVTLVAQASNGQADAEVKTNYITVNPLPTAGFSTSTNGCALPVGVTFSNVSVGGASYIWDFGNGQTSTNQNQTGTEFWNGKTDSGEPVNEGTYFYIFDGTLKDGTYLKKDGFVDVYKKN